MSRIVFYCYAMIILVGSFKSARKYLVYLIDDNTQVWSICESNLFENLSFRHACRAGQQINQERM